MSNITELKPNQIFVFGSNTKGEHLGGAARQAYEQFGAVWGHGRGIQGDSYAVPTIGDRGNVLSLGTIKNYLYMLRRFAELNKDKEFLLTPIGTGIAGYTIDEIKNIMPDMPSNVIRVGNWE